MFPEAQGCYDIDENDELKIKIARADGLMYVSFDKQLLNSSL